jgi:hypothetical protein
MSTVVLLLNQDGISELIQTANDIQNKVDNVMGAGKDKTNQDRIADAGASSFLEVAREKLPIIMEEGDNEGEIKATTVSSTSSSKSKVLFKHFLLNY